MIAPPTLRFVKYWLPALLWMAFIFFMSTDVGSATHTSRILGPLLRWLRPDITREQLEWAQFLVRKVGHLTEYAVLAALLRRAIQSLPASTATWPGKIAGLAWVGAVAYAVSDEFHQSFVSTRTASVGDVLIDAIGAGLGLALVFLWRWFSGRYHNRAVGAAI